MGSGIVSPWHIVILVLVLLVIFGPRRLPEMGRSLGKGMREFKDSISGAHGEEQSLEPPATTATPEAASGTREYDSV